MSLFAELGEMIADLTDPDPEERVRGKCPVCGAPVVSCTEYVQGRGYLIWWKCWRSMQLVPACDYRRIL